MNATPTGGHAETVQSALLFLVKKQDMTVVFRARTCVSEWTPSQYFCHTERNKVPTAVFGDGLCPLGRVCLCAFPPPLPAAGDVGLMADLLKDLEDPETLKEVEKLMKVLNPTAPFYVYTFFLFVQLRFFTLFRVGRVRFVVAS